MITNVVKKISFYKLKKLEDKVSKSLATSIYILKNYPGKRYHVHMFLPILQKMEAPA